MTCGGCAKHRVIKEQKKENYDVMGGYGNLPDRQIKARLEVYKKRYCKECEKRYECNFVMYSNCRKNTKEGKPN